MTFLPLFTPIPAASASIASHRQPLPLHPASYEHRPAASGKTPLRPQPIGPVGPSPSPTPLVSHLVRFHRPRSPSSPHLWSTKVLGRYAPTTAPLTQTGRMPECAPVRSTVAPISGFPLRYQSTHWVANHGRSRFGIRSTRRQLSPVALLVLEKCDPGWKRLPPWLQTLRIRMRTAPLDETSPPYC